MTNESRVVDRTATCAAGTPPTLTVVAPTTKPWPITSTAVPPAVLPRAGVIEDSVSAPMAKLAVTLRACDIVTEQVPVAAVQAPTSR